MKEQVGTLTCKRLVIVLHGCKGHLDAFFADFLGHAFGAFFKQACGVGAFWSDVEALIDDMIQYSKKADGIELAIRSKAYRGDPVFMALELALLLSSLSIPDYHSLVFASAYYTATIGTKSQTAEAKTKE